MSKNNREYEKHVILTHPGALAYPTKEDFEKKFPYKRKNVGRINFLPLADSDSMNLRNYKESVFKLPFNSSIFSINTNSFSFKSSI